jgi:hypothetical protein
MLGYKAIFSKWRFYPKKTLIGLSAIVRALKFVLATSALIVARLTIRVDRSTMPLIENLG